MRRRRLTGQEQWLRSQSEAAFQAGLLRRAGWLGYRRHHVYDSRLAAVECDPGWPDLELLRLPGVRGGLRLIYAELKDEQGDVSDDQREILDALMLVAGVEVYLWRPSDVDEAIRVLEADGPVESETEWRVRRRTCERA